MSLYEKLINHEEKLALVGLGYVGMPIAVAFAKKGLDVVGFDLNKEKINLYKSGIDPTKEVGDEVIKTMKSMDGYKSGYEKFPSELSLKAQKSCHEYNKTAPDETEKYHKIVGKFYFKLGGIFLLTLCIAAFTACQNSDHTF